MTSILTILFSIFNWYLPFSASDVIFDFSNSGYVSGNRQASHCLVWLWSFFQCFVTGQRISAVFSKDPVPMKMLTSCYQSASSREYLSIQFRPALTSWLLSWLLWRSFKDVRNDFKLSNLHVCFYKLLFIQVGRGHRAVQGAHGGGSLTLQVEEFVWFPITRPSRPQSPRLRLRLFFWGLLKLSCRML